MLEQIAGKVAEYGLTILGSFNVSDEMVPAFSGGGRPHSMALIGAAGSSMWPVFSSSPEYRSGLPDPLDRWSRRIGDGVARHLGAEAVYPFGADPPLPFLRWAAMARASQPSRIGLFIHRDFGLWHAYRFALMLPESMSRQDDVPMGNLCAECASQACVSACPVDAFGRGAFDIQACAAHLMGNPGCDCTSDGCLSRRACPVAVEFRYLPPHARFHMRAFVEAVET